MSITCSSPLIMTADSAFKSFMKGKAGFPKFKRRNGRPVSIYLPRNNAGDLKIERHRGKLPILGWIRFKEYGYVPPSDAQALSVTITRRAGRYYASFLFESGSNCTACCQHTEGIGIDLGIKSFAVLSDGRSYPNINKTDRMRKLTRRLRREQHKFSRKIHKLLQRKEVTANKKCTRSNLDKQRLKVQRAYKRLTDKRHDYICKTVHEIVSTRPEFIVIEDLNVKGMMSNRHLTRAIAECEFWHFRAWLEHKCIQYGIQLRVAGSFYASSKTCSNCGYVKKDLKLSDRVYVCPECGVEVDRDMNAAVNLRDCDKFRTAG